VLLFSATRVLLLEIKQDSQCMLLFRQGSHFRHGNAVGLESQHPCGGCSDSHGDDGRGIFGEERYRQAAAFRVFDRRERESPTDVFYGSITIGLLTGMAAW